jgi:hypothetical protein
MAGPMDPAIIRVAEGVEIAAPPATVFALVSDPQAKARLNPNVQVIRVEREDPGPLCEGSVTFLRLQKGRRIFEYRTRCERLEAGRLLEHRAQLPTLVRVRVEVDPVPRGTRLTQHEECEATLEMLEALPGAPRAEWPWRAARLLHLLLPELAAETFAVILRQRAALLERALRRELRDWLAAIKDHLETQYQERSMVR